MARSMVSMGTEASRAFVNIVRSVALELTSPPPSRAATSTWRISLAKSLPRALSWAPFLCLIVAHLECPDMVLQLLQESVVEAEVVGELRVEGRHGHVALATEDRVAVDRGEHVDTATGALDERRPDEDRAEGIVPLELIQREVGLEGVDLAAEGVAAHGDV